MKRHLTLTVTALAGLAIIFGIATVGRWRGQAEREHWQLLLTYVTKYGEKRPYLGRVLGLFELPQTDYVATWPTIVASTEDGKRTKTLAVVERDGRNYAYITDAYSDHGWFYVADDEGRPLKAAALDDELHSVPDRVERFAAEKKFWLNWWEEYRAVRFQSAPDTSDSAARP